MASSKHSWITSAPLGRQDPAACGPSEGGEEVIDGKNKGEHFCWGTTVERLLDAMQIVKAQVVPFSFTRLTESRVIFHVKKSCTKGAEPWMKAVLLLLLVCILGETFRLCWRMKH
jgi:hypothetical protein